jgi:hypothetical protein
MNIEFHYYAIHFLCKSAGFDENDALTVAISSQLVDDCVAPWELVGGGRSRRTQVTQNYQFWDAKVAEDIYRPFHFIPGDKNLASQRRNDGRAGNFPVTEDSALAKEILVAALKSGNLYRIGIAVHAYADTWAHQNFSGDSEPENALDRDSPLPAAGHLQAFRNPDDPVKSWRDGRLRPEYSSITNADRFTRAATMIHRYLRTYKKRGFSDETLVISRLREYWDKAPAYSDTAARIPDYIIDLDVPPYRKDAWPTEAGGRSNSILGDAKPYDSGYDKLSWLRGAASKATSALGSIRGIIPIETYNGSDFERWNRAAEDHRTYCHTIFRQRGIG